MLVSLLGIIILSARAQEDVTRFNFGFEQLEDGRPEQWSVGAMPGNSVSVDSMHVHSGKYSLCVESTGIARNFQMVAFVLPDNYAGKKITLSGYIKTENVTDGYAGLWMRIDPRIAFENMYQRGVTQTTDWERYEVSLLLKPDETEHIVVGGMLVGKGKVWFDDFSVTIDGQDITGARIYEKTLLPADKDKEFDKGSGVVFPGILDRRTIANLELLGRVWGFIKYHHPSVAAGNYNWDYELFRMLPRYLNTGNARARDRYLIEWIDGLGVVDEVEEPVQVRSDVYIGPDLSWMDELSAELREAMMYVYENRNRGGNYYIEMQPNIGNPKFMHENPYAYMPYPDAGFRLLSLYRYWNAVQYFFPEKRLADKDWNTVLGEYIPVFIGARSELEYELAALRIIGEVDDTHADIWSGGDKTDSLRGDNYAPFRVQFVENKWVVAGYYDPGIKGDLMVGDIITHIGGRSVESIIDSLRSYYPASNEPARLRNISIDLLRSPYEGIDIDYLSSGQAKHTRLQIYPQDSLGIYRYYEVGKNEKCYKLLDGNIGYITLANITDRDIPAIKESFRNTRGIVIDIRNYPSAFVPYSLGSYFVSDATPFVRFTKGSVRNPGVFAFMEPAVIAPDGNKYSGKLVVIVNEETVSRAEFTAMAFRAGDNTTIIGSTTAGADGNTSEIFLPGGLLTRISGLGVYYPDGGQTQRIGIVPDVVVRPTIQGIIEGRDEVLEQAIEIINRQ